MIITLSGKTCTARSWDGGIRDDPNDPYWHEFATIFNASKLTRVGKGWHVKLDVPVHIAEYIAIDLQENGEMYVGPGMAEGCAADGRAMLWDAKRIMAALPTED